MKILNFAKLLNAKLLVITGLAIIPGPMSGQISFGIKGGVGLSSLTLKDELSNELSNSLFFSIGPSVKWNIPIQYLSVDASAIYEQSNAMQISNDLVGATIYKTTIKQQRIAIPINLRIGIPYQKDKEIYVYSGPQVGFNVGNDIKLDYGEWVPKSTELSFNVGLGMTTAKNFETSIGYHTVCGKCADIWINRNSENSAKIVNKGRFSCWQINLSFYF